MKTIQELAEQLFLTDIVETRVYKELLEQIQSKYERDDEDEFPDAYYDELNEQLQQLFRACVDLAKPQGPKYGN